MRQLGTVRRGELHLLLGSQMAVSRFKVACQRFWMERCFDVELQKPAEFVPVRYGSCFFGQLLEDSARVIGAAEKSAVNSLGSAFHYRPGGPHESHTERGAYRHSILRMLQKIAREKSRKQENRQQATANQQNEIPALHEKIPHAVPK